MLIVKYNNPPDIKNINIKGDYVTRIIKTSTPGKERVNLSKAIVITIREFMRHQEPSHETHDMVAFIILALEEISGGIDKSVAAWEKRGYWVKADKYRMEWHWCGEYAKKLRNAFTDQDWHTIADLLINTMTKFANIKVSDRHRMGKPWRGAQKEYKNHM